MLLSRVTPGSALTRGRRPPPLQHSGSAPSRVRRWADRPIVATSAAVTTEGDVTLNPAPTKPAGASEPETSTAGTSSTEASSPRAAAIRVSQSSNPGKVAGAIVGRLEESTSVEVQVVGQEASSIAMLAIIYAQRMVAANKQGCLHFQPQRQRLDPRTSSSGSTPDEGPTRPVAWSLFVTLDADSTFELIAGAADHAIRVGGKTDPNKLSRSITRRLQEEGGRASLGCVGTAASYVTLKAMVLARNWLVNKVGQDFNVVPTRVAVGSGEEEEGAIRNLTLYHLYTCATRPGAVQSARSRAARRREVRPGQVVVSKAELEDMRAQLAAVPALTQQLELMTQQHKQLLELLAAGGAAVQGGKGSTAGDQASTEQT